MYNSSKRNYTKYWQHRGLSVRKETKYFKRFRFRWGNLREKLLLQRQVTKLPLSKVNICYTAIIWLQAVRIRKTTWTNIIHSHLRNIDIVFLGAI